MILNWAFLESGRRPPESVDTSGPAEHSRQNVGLGSVALQIQQCDRLLYE